MHYHCEIILPPGTDVERVSEVLEPFSEDNEEAAHAFWDWYVIGGRFAGSKQEAAIPKERLESFEEWMRQEKVMVEGVICGKQRIASPEQQEAVDAKWNEMFPEHPGPCPMFAHANDQYSSESLLPGDVCRVGDIPEQLHAARVIVAGPDYSDPTKLRAVTMLAKGLYNGVILQDTAWDGSVRSALVEHAKNTEFYVPEFQEKVTVTDDWLCVTVDYHS